MYYMHCFFFYWIIFCSFKYLHRFSRNCRLTWSSKFEIYFEIMIKGLVHQQKKRKEKKERREEGTMGSIIKILEICAALLSFDSLNDSRCLIFLQHFFEFILVDIVLQ